MSLDVYLKIPIGNPREPRDGIFVRRNGSTVEITRKEWDMLHPTFDPVSAVVEDDGRTVYTANITHNLGRMATEAGIYYELWRPEEIGLTKAEQLIPRLQQGLNKLNANPDTYRQYNPENGWGTYEGLVDFVRKYLAACEMYPNADVSVWR